MYRGQLKRKQQDKKTNNTFPDRHGRKNNNQLL